MKCEANTLTPKSILVVDDDGAVADTLRLLLVTDKHRVEIAGEAGAALAKYEEGKFDLVITDFRMPGMDGLSLAGLIKGRAPQQAIILVTAYSEIVSGKEKTRLEHVDGVLAKPFSPQQLQDALRAVFPQG
jgi:CheY-like chemotaxis protein